MHSIWSVQQNLSLSLGRFREEQSKITWVRSACKGRSGIIVEVEVGYCVKKFCHSLLPWQCTQLAGAPCRVWLQMKKFKNKYFHSKVYCVHIYLTYFCLQKNNLGSFRWRGRPLKGVIWKIKDLTISFIFIFDPKAPQISIFNL